MSKKYLGKYLLATSLSLLFVSGVCLASSNIGLSFWDTEIGTVIESIQDNLLLILGGICVLMIIIGGAFYMTAQDDEKKTKRGMDTVKVALIGLVIVLAAAMLMNFVNELGK